MAGPMDFRMPDLSHLNRDMEEFGETLRRRNNPAGHMFERLQPLINQFLKQLPADREVGMSVVGGTAKPFLLRSVRVSNPDMLIFTGIDEDKNAVQLITHHSQMGVQLVSLPKSGDEPVREIGFHAKL